MSICHIFVLILPASVAATWVLGADGESCSAACAHTKKVCTERGLLLHNGQVNSNGEVDQLVKNLNGTGRCISHNRNYGLKSDVPAYQASTGECYISSSGREESSFSCEREAPAGKQRLCWCHAADVATLGTMSTESGARSRDDAESLSIELIIWIVCGNLLFLVLVSMCVCAVCSAMKKGDVAPDSAHGKSGVARVFMRCPACNCSLQQSRSVNSVSYEVTESRAFRAGDSSSRDTAMGALKMGDEYTPKSAMRSPWNHSKRTRPSVSFHIGSKSNSESLVTVAEEKIEKMQENV